MIDLHQGDCLAVMPRMPARSYDVVVTSPPYNLKIKYGTYRDNLPYKDYLSWTDRWVREAARVLDDDGSLFVVVADLPRNLNLSDDVSRVARRHLVLQNRIVWVKSIHVRGRTHGHHRPTTSPRYLDVTHETILHFTRRGDVPLDRHAEGVGVPYTDPRNETRYKHRNKLRCAGTPWHIPSKTICGGRGSWGHPATFPVGVPSRCIRLHGLRPHLRVLDPFAGVGSTGVAAKRLDVECTLIELDEEYCEVARQRIAAASDKAQAMMF